MKHSEIRDRLYKLRDSSPAYDPETAHLEEDQIHIDILKAIRDGGISDPREAARLALITLEFEFPRWYA